MPEASKGEPCIKQGVEQRRRERVNVSTDEVMICGVGSHDAIDSGRVDTSNKILLDESTELRVITNSLDHWNGEDPEKTEDPVSRVGVKP
jgi:hypothetical protein